MVSVWRTTPSSQYSPQLEARGSLSAYQRIALTFDISTIYCLSPTVNSLLRWGIVTINVGNAVCDTHEVHSCSPPELPNDTKWL
jgi:hypothetical protein